jgi:PAS domain S-box-containing protein
VLQQSNDAPPLIAESVGKTAKAPCAAQLSREARIAALQETLRDTEQQLEALTGAERDTAADQAGRNLLLRSAEDQMRQQEARKQSLLDALPAHVALLDAKGTIIAVNEAWRRFANENGLRDTQYGVGRNYLDACGPPPGPAAAETWAVATSLRAVLAGERSNFSLEYSCDSPDERRRFMIMAAPLEPSRRTGAVVMHINVSARARAERAALRTTELLQAVADGTPDMVYVKDIAGDYVLCNKAFAAFTGRSIDQILGCDDFALYDAAEAGSTVDQDRTMFARSTTVQATERWFTGVNGRRLFHTTLAPYRDALGAVIGTIGIARDITEDRLAQEELRESKALLEMAGRSAKVGGWSFDVDQQRLRWSDIVAGMQDEGARNRPSLELALAAFIPEHRAAVRDAVECCIASGTPFDMEAEKISVLGRHFWVRTIGEAVRNAEGRIVRIQGALQDITERKLAAHQTQKLAQRLSNTLESITDAFFTVDRDWRYTYINRQAERLLGGKDRDKILGCVMWNVFPELIGTIFEQSYRRAMGGETGISFEAQCAATKTWVGVDCHPSDDGASVYFRDVTESRASRQQLKLLEASVAQLNDIVIIAEPAPELPQGLRIVFVNDAFVRVSGYERAEVLGQSPRLLSGPLSDPAEFARIRAATDRFEPVHAELLEYTKSGQSHWVELDLTPVAIDGGTYTHFIAVLRDISERRQNEEALRELNAGLEDRVRLRTLELEFARESAEQATRAKSSFLATMSHEIRTPMNGIIGMIDVLEESNIRSEQRDMMKTVRESAYSLMAIVDDVLDFSKIEAGQFAVAHESLDVATLVEGVCDALRGLSESKGVGLQLYIDPRLPSQLLGDAGRLRQVLMNLIGNAIKFSSGHLRPGLVSLRALRIAADDGDDTLALVVTDNGIGMDSKTISRLFSPFTQADASTTRRFGGTGLGLTISHRLVALMGGDISVSSQVGQGSSFTARLPLVFPTAGDGAIQMTPAQSLAGLPCLVLGASGSAADLADYVAHAGGAVLLTPTLGEALAWLRLAGPGHCVVIVTDPPEGIDPVLAVFRAVALECPETRLAFVVIETGRRRRPRRQKPDQFGLDGECLHRAVFLRTVALAGRLETAYDDIATPAHRYGRADHFEPSWRSGTELLILVAEDNEINQKVLSKQLALLGYRAEMVGNGVEALEHWRRGGHALLLTDLHMPRMDGYELAAAVRAEEGGGPRMPIIALTANALRGEELRCRQLGMDGYLTKPVRLAQLKEAIEVWLCPSQPSGVKPDGATQIGPPPADLDVLADLVGDDPQAIQGVLHAFRKSTSNSTQELSRARVDGSVTAVADIAHRLKSAARAIGAARLAQICDGIEEAAPSNSRSTALDTLMAAFSVELRAVHRFLDARAERANLTSCAFSPCPPEPRSTPVL